ncbi:denticleless protein homolog [Anolis sagrei]|uniref:denticleless protein homolog n=1 Tax=Anolis sagrei TaxID=38937 RepID=UPI0035200627
MLCRSLVHRCQGGPHGLLPRFSLQHLLGCYSCTREDDHPSFGEMGIPVPPFGCTFSTAPNAQHILAVANEEGIVRLYDTHASTSSKKIFREWQAHSNAVFDLAWMPREHKIVTASGDQTAKVWDVRTGELLGVCKGHQCSLKSVAFSKFESAVFCTGGRDGNIMVWDTRCNKKDGFYRQVKQISGAHNITDKQTPSKLKKKKQNSRGLAPSVDFQQSVTVVLLQDEHTLISAGAVDGVIKIWDLRKNYTSYRQDPLPSRSFSYSGNSTRKLGYSSLVLDSTGTSLFANCTDDNIYMFSMPSLKTTPESLFSGHQNSSFYVKSSISPDDQFLISGSSDHNAYIWKVSEPHLPPMMLHGHLQEVTSVAWCPSDFTKISTCSDDNTIKIWRLKQHSAEETQAEKSSLVGWACQKKVEGQNGTGALRKRHNTPAKVLPAGSPPISSPQPAACAPAYTGDLPLPTNTPTWSLVNTSASTTMTSVPSRQQMEGTSPKLTPPSAMSIRQWVTKTPSLSPPLKGKEVLSPQQELSEPTFVSKSTHLRSEVRAKRRLESSKEVNAKCLKSCNCVAELHPVSKKSRLEQDTLADSEPCEEKCLTLGRLAQSSESLAKDPPPASGSPCSSAGAKSLSRLLKVSCDEMTDKENGCPDRRNWLSALGNKLQTNKSKSPNGAGSKIQSLQNLGARQPESRTGGPISATSVPMRKICTYFERKSQKN